MADAVQSIRDLVAGFNQIQQQMGLTPLSANMAGFMPPQTPVANQMAQLKSPAEIAGELSAQMTQQTQTATRTFQAQSQFAQEFGQRMQNIRAQYVAPQAAQYMARTSGAPSFGMEGPLGDMPSPIYQTPVEMGLYRPTLPRPGMQAPSGVQGTGFNAPMPAPFIPQPYMPLGPGGPYLGNMLPQVFGGEAPLGRFGDPWQRQQMQQEYMGNRAFSQAMAVTPTAFTTLPGAGLGAAGGAAIGGRMGGGRGALLGAGLGFVGGGMAGQPLFEGLGFGQMGEAMVEPSVRTRAFGNQLEAMSRQFVTSGPDLHPLGRGLGQRPAIGLANQLQTMTEQGQMGEYNMRDVMKITSMAGQGGMLDMAQSGPQIASQVRNVARALQNFMQIAEEPDIQRAMQMMSNMRAFGLSIPETQIAARNAQQFARMAGTSTQALMATAGAQGAMVFQQQGLTGGLGMEVGMGAAGMARAAIAGGTYTPAQLALAGGQQGLTQSLTEASAANLNVRFPMWASLSRNEGGELTIDPERLTKIMSGGASLNQQMAMASDNIRRLAQSGGTSPERVISEISSRTRELQDEMGRRMGPLGTNTMLIRQALNIQQEFGGNIDLASAIRHASGNTMSHSAAQSLALLAQNPETWTNIQQSMLTDVPRLRQLEAQRREGLVDAGSAATRRQVFRPLYQVGEGMGDFAGGFNEAFRDLREDVGSWFTGGGTTPSGGRRIQRSRRFGIDDSEVARGFRKDLLGDEGLKYLQGGDVQRVAGAQGRGEALTWQQELASQFNVMKEVVPAALTMGSSWAVQGAAAVGGGLVPDAPQAAQSRIVAQARARGGGWGTMAEYAPSVANLMLAGGRSDSGLRGLLFGGAIQTGMEGIERIRGESYASQMEREAEGVAAFGKRSGATATELKEFTGEFNRAYGETGKAARTSSYAIDRAVGGMSAALTARAKAGRTEGMKTGAILGMLAPGAGNVLGGAIGYMAGRPKNLSDEEMKQLFIESEVAQGGDRTEITKRVNADWDGKLRDVVRQQLAESGSPEAKAAVAAADMAGGIGAAATIEDARKKAEEQSEQTTGAALKSGGGAGMAARAGVGGGLGALVGLAVAGPIGAAIGAEIGAKALSGPSRAVQKKFEETLMGNKEDDVILLAAADAIAEDDPEGAENIRRGVEAKINDPEKFKQLKNKARTRVSSTTDADKKKALLMYGRRVRDMDTEAARKDVAALRGDATKTRMQLAFREGAQKVADEEKRTVESVLEEARTDKNMAAKVQKRAAESGEFEVGGPGTGGAGEKALRKTTDDMGKMGLDVAKFNKAVDKLASAAESLGTAGKAQALGIAAGMGHR